MSYKKSKIQLTHMPCYFGNNNTKFKKDKKNKKKDKGGKNKKSKFVYKVEDDSKETDNIINALTKNDNSCSRKVVSQKQTLNQMAQKLCNKIVFMYFNGALYYYNGTIYKKLNACSGISLLKKSIPLEESERLNINDYREIIFEIKTTPEIIKSEEEIIIPENLICFKNGVYDIEKHTLKKHNSKYYFFSCINHDLNLEKTGKGDVFDNYLDTCFGDDNDLKKLFMEMIGYILCNSMKAKKIFLIWGPHDSGKTTLGDFMQHLIGKENCCNIQPQDFSKRFQVAELLGKKLCFNMDILDSNIKDTSILKRLSGGDMINAEFKNEEPFSFLNQAKLLYGTNNLPRVDNAESNEAFFSRLIIIPYMKSIPLKNQNKNLIYDLIKESNYIICKSLEALSKLKGNNYIFTSCKAVEKLKRKYIESQSTVIEFVNNQCILEDSHKVHSQVLYEHYKKFCEKNGYEKDCVDLHKFSSIIIENFNSVKRKKWRDHKDTPKNGFVGIDFKNN